MRSYGCGIYVYKVIIGLAFNWMSLGVQAEQDPSLPRASIEAVSYKVSLPGGGVTYPSLHSCLPAQTFHQVGALAMDEAGMAILVAGLESLYGSSFAERIQDVWLKPSEPSNALAGLVALRVDSSQSANRDVDGLSVPVEASAINLHACELKLAADAEQTPINRSKVSSITYELRLPDGNTIFPTMDFCARESSAKDVVLIAFSNAGVAIAAEGLKRLYGVNTAQAMTRDWLKKPHSYSTRLASMVTVQYSDVTKTATLTPAKVVGRLTVPAASPVIMGRCSDTGVGGTHLPE